MKNNLVILKNLIFHIHSEYAKLDNTQHVFLYKFNFVVKSNHFTLTLMLDVRPELSYPNYYWVIIDIFVRVVILVVEFKLPAPHRRVFESCQGLNISCEEVIQLDCSLSVVLLRCPFVREIIHGGT
jgi:hypothetical protein